MPRRTDMAQFPSRPGQRVIVRYPNRKFYDLRTSSYVTLAQMQAMAAKGDRLYVYGRVRKRCITNQTLCQIIAQASKTGAVFSEDALLKILQTLPPSAAVKAK